MLYRDMDNKPALRTLLAVIIASILPVLARWLPPLVAVVPLVGAAALLLWAQRDELARLWRRGLVLLASPRARWFMGGLALLVGVAALLLPDIAHADEPLEPCAETNIDCQMDRMKYSVLKYMALGIWQINRLFLALARWLEVLREQLIAEDGFATGLVDAITEGMLAPFWFAVAVAMVFFAIGFFARPLMNFDLVEMRKGIRNFVLAMLLFALGGQALSGMENLRITVTQGLTGMVGGATTDMSGIESSLGYANPSLDDDATKMRAITRGIYSPQVDAESRCGGGELTTRSGVTADAIFFQDVAAAYLYAMPFDIWCPTFEGNLGSGLKEIGVLLPVDFALGGANQGAYFSTVGLGGNDDDTEREEVINKATNGVARMAFGVQLTITGALEQLMHLIFVIAMINSWIGMIISVIFVLFLPTEDLFFRHARDIFNILRASWIAAVWMGILMSLIAVASSANNALLISGTGILAMVVIIWQTVAAVGVLVNSLKTSMDSVGVAPQAVGGAATGVAAGVAGAGFALRDFQQARSAGHDTRRSLLEGMRGYEEGHAMGEKPIRGITARSRRYLRRAERQEDLDRKLATAQAGATGNSSSNNGGDADSNGEPPAPWYEQAGHAVSQGGESDVHVHPVLVMPTTMPSTIEGEDDPQPSTPPAWYEQTGAPAPAPAAQTGDGEDPPVDMRKPTALESLDARLTSMLETPAGAREGRVTQDAVRAALAENPAITPAEMGVAVATALAASAASSEPTREAAALVVNNPDNEQFARDFLVGMGQRMADSPHGSATSREAGERLQQWGSDPQSSRLSPIRETMGENPAGEREGQVLRDTISPMLAQTPAPTERELARELAHQMHESPGIPEATREAAALVVNNPDNEQFARDFLDRVGQRVADSPHTTDDAHATANMLFARLQHEETSSRPGGSDDDESPGLPSDSAESDMGDDVQRVDSTSTMRYQRERQSYEDAEQPPDSGATPISEAASSDGANTEEERQASDAANTEEEHTEEQRSDETTTQRRRRQGGGRRS